MRVSESVKPGAGNLAMRDPLVGVLGPVSVRRDGALTSVAGRRLRTVLAALALDPGRFRSATALIDDVWGAELPREPANALHTQLSRLRSLLPADALEQGPAGYRLAVARDRVDLTLAEDCVASAATEAGSGSPEIALAKVVSSQGLWRGVPGDDLPDGAVRDRLAAVVARLRKSTVDVQVDGAIAVGRYEDALPLLREICEADPLDEPSHAKLMRVLAAVGRGNEAVTLYAAVRSRLAHRLGTDPSGELTSVHLAILRGELTAHGEGAEGFGIPGELPSGAPRAIGLRSAPNRLIGRGEDVANLHALLQASRVVTILGPGGTGKTRLANHVGGDIADGGRVALVELVGVRSSEDVFAAVTGTLGLSETDMGPDGMLRRRVVDMRSRLRAVLAASPMLLVLDNCEHVIDACADLVADLVASCPDLTVLTTSRTPLMIAAETTYPLAPLSIDEHGSPATELFEIRARSVRPSVRLDIARVARLCRTLDGLPLAIELAAARVRTMSVEQITAKLSDRFALLQSGDRVAPRRHRTLHAVIEWSWNLLTADEQAALRRLCRMPGGFTIEAARRIVGPELGADSPATSGRGHVGPGSAEVDDAINGLVNQSLLEVTEGPEPVGLRYHMLETVREFGEKQLTLVPGEADEVARRCADWAADFTTAVAGKLVAGWTGEVSAAVESEQENLVAVLRRALTDRDARPMLTTFTVLAGFWSMRGAHSEAAVWASRVQQYLTEREGSAVDNTAAAGNSDPDSARDGAPVASDPLSWAMDPTIDADMVCLAALLVAAYAFVMDEMREMARSRTRVRRLLQRRLASSPEVDFLARIIVQPTAMSFGRTLSHGVRSESSGVRCIAHVLRAHAHENSGRRHSAHLDAVRALDLARQRGDSWIEGMAAQLLGQLASQAARYDEAVGYYRLAAKIMWDVRAYEESIQVRGFIASALVGAGRPEAGRREALLARGAGDGVAAHTEARPGSSNPVSQYRAALLGALAEADLAEGKIDAGLDLYRQGLHECIGSYESEAVAAADPYASLIVSAAICAHADGGALDHAQEIARVLVRTLVPRLTAGATGGRETFVDLPITGSVLLALTAVDIARGSPGEDPAQAGWELALARRANARQDYPALRIDRWTAAARLVFGDEVVDSETRRVATLTRLELVRALAEALNRPRGLTSPAADRRR